MFDFKKDSWFSGRVLFLTVIYLNGGGQTI